MQKAATVLACPSALLHINPALFRRLTASLFRGGIFRRNLHKVKILPTYLLPLNTSFTCSLTDDDKVSVLVSWSSGGILLQFSKLQQVPSTDFSLIDAKAIHFTSVWYLHAQVYIHVHKGIYWTQYKNMHVPVECSTRIAFSHEKAYLTASFHIRFDSNCPFSRASINLTTRVISCSR